MDELDREKVVADRLARARARPGPNPDYSLVGQTFGLLKVEGYNPHESTKRQDGSRFDCVCSGCKSVVTRRAVSLRRNKARTCGAQNCKNLLRGLNETKTKTE